MLRLIFAFVFVAAVAIGGLLLSKGIGPKADVEVRIAGCINGLCS
jgi:hypothetical protein